MIENFVAVTKIGYAGLAHAPVIKSLYSGKEGPEAEEIRVQKALKEKREKVQPVYNAKGKIVKHDENGRHLDIIIECSKGRRPDVSDRK